jgi:Holliday junction resolvase RusA-like endonuclease
VLLKFEVKGTAVPQGSKAGVIRGKTAKGAPKVVMVDSSKDLDKWRDQVSAAAQLAAGLDWPPIDGPVIVWLAVYLQKPKATRFREYPAGPPDVDKLQRAVGDALKKARIITDDSRIVQWIAGKRWAPPGQPPFAAIQLDYYPPTEGTRNARTA